MALEHDHVQRRLLKPGALFGYRDSEPKTKSKEKTPDVHLMIEANILADEARWEKPTELSDQDLLDWLGGDFLDKPKRNSMQILFPIPVEARPPTLSVPEGFMEGLEKYFTVPSEFYRVLHRSLPIQVQFTSSETKTGAKIHGLIIRNQAASLMEYTLLHMYIPDRNASTSLCFGLEAQEIRRMLAYLLSSCRSGVSHLLLPFLLLDEAVEVSSSFIDRRRESMQAMQKDAKLDLFLRRSNQDTKKDAIDMDHISKSLTSCSTSIATLICSAKAHRRFIKLLGELCGESPPRHSPESALTVEKWLMPRLEARLKYLNDVTVAIEEEGDFLQTSIQTQVQTVHNLIAQEDARVQRELSELSTAMAAITRRDSTDMRVIAGVTLFFLPGTFAATLFSTSFFDFKPGSKGSHLMSDWFWLYWIVAAFLTVVVWLAWVYTAHRENNKMNKDLQEKSDREKRAEGSTTSKDQITTNRRFDHNSDDMEYLDNQIKNPTRSLTQEVATDEAAAWSGKQPIVGPSPFVDGTTASQAPDAAPEVPLPDVTAGPEEWPALAVQQGHVDQGPVFHLAAVPYQNANTVERQNRVNVPPQPLISRPPDRRRQPPRPPPRFGMAGGYERESESE